MVIQKKLKNIESVRFLFAVTIVYFHILNSNIIPFIGNNKLYLELQKSGFHQATIVECFFIISGYFLFQTLLHKPDLSISQFIVNKVVRLWPVLAFSIIISVIFGWVNRYEAIFQILFLQCIGISLDYKGINWYVSPFFWGIIGIFALIKIFKREKGSFFLAIAVYFSYVTNINYLNGTFGRDTIWNFLSLAMLRAIAGIGLGYFIGLTWETFSEKFNGGGYPAVLHPGCTSC